MFKQQLHHFDSVLLAGDVKGSKTILSRERKKESKKKYQYKAQFSIDTQKVITPPNPQNIDFSN